MVKVRTQIHSKKRFASKKRFVRRLPAVLLATALLGGCGGGMLRYMGFPEVDFQERVASARGDTLHLARGVSGDGSEALRMSAESGPMTLGVPEGGLPQPERNAYPADPSKTGGAGIPHPQKPLSGSGAASPQGADGQDERLPDGSPALKQTPERVVPDRMRLWVQCLDGTLQVMVVTDKPLESRDRCMAVEATAREGGRERFFRTKACVSHYSPRVLELERPVAFTDFARNADSLSVLLGRDEEEPVRADFSPVSDPAFVDELYRVCPADWQPESPGSSGRDGAGPRDGAGSGNPTGGPATEPAASGASGTGPAYPAPPKGRPIDPKAAPTPFPPSASSSREGGQSGSSRPVASAKAGARTAAASGAQSGTQSGAAGPAVEAPGAHASSASGRASSGGTSSGSSANGLPPDMEEQLRQLEELNRGASSI